jgi:hypothetical protein
MKTFRIVLGILVIIPLGLMAYHILFESTYYGDDSPVQMAYMILGVPILALNLWAWMYPEIIEYYFFRKENAK